MKAPRPLRLRVSFLVLIAVLLVEQTISQTQPTQPTQGTTSSSKTTAPQPKPNCTNNGTYVNSKGQTVKRPENCSGPPQGATAQCRDGTYSFSKSRRGTCSRHAGVAKWL